MPQARPDQLRLLAPDQETAVLAVVNDLLTGDTTDVPDYLADDIAAVRTLCRFSPVKIPGDGGVLLDAMAAWPRTDGPHPVIVLPAGLDPTGWKMYSGAMIRLLMRGYAVVAYTERGLPGSEGELTVAGPEDVADGRRVIDWALDHPDLGADADRIGMAGISYGSGIAQLVAQADKRVKAVVALSTWADLGEALYDNHTRHILAAEALAAISEHPSPELQKVLEEFRANTNIEGVLEYARLRSPAHIPAGERRRVPTFFTSYWHETIFPQNQLLNYFTEFPGPKRLDLAVGDHGAVEVPGLLLGIYTRTTEAAYDWLDHFLCDVDNGIDSDGAVHTETMYSFTMTASPDLASWAETGRTYYLAAPTGESPDGALVPDPPKAFEQTIRTGAPHVHAVNQLVMDGFRERLLIPVRQKLADVDRSTAAVWKTPVPFLMPRHIAGIPKVHLTATASTRAVTVIAYLFDLNPVTGTLRIITHAAATVHNPGPEQPSPIELPLQATDYRVPIGNKLALILATEDPLYAGETEPDSTVTFDGPARLDIPMTP
ncbi:alpha/beta hydrolase fold domain-containing protein [Nocardia sp. NEAU-G5]|uniref:Alpha/beta hydrolase fold domain-containing protein n=1 Tax=Nocardia albiluteola TaxID=2842303 RepID=A0ABS6BA86_9NOCA|nr:CocE/NonD family hydrolase [Nocardia albiluteola]MBU3067212.1 alpha/beta hydrolase fold domain-containing protein [Nocardia albiluteola]